MMRSELYALLTLSQSQSVVKTSQAMYLIKSAVQSILKGTQNLDSFENLNDILEGWNKVVHAMIRQNYLTDVRAVNIPKDLEKEPPSCGKSYIFAGFYPPGNHNFLIYDPLLDKVFIKDIVVQLNTFETYPEYPRMIAKAKNVQPKKNVWRKWIEDTPETEVKVYHFDLTSNLYDPAPIIRND